MFSFFVCVSSLPSPDVFVLKLFLAVCFMSMEYHTREREREG